MVGSGSSYKTIAESLTKKGYPRTEKTVMGYCHRHRYTPSHAGLSMQATARYFGVHQWTVKQWIKLKKLRFTRIGLSGTKRDWFLIRESAIEKFIEDESTWHLWDPAELSDPIVREWATDLRQGVKYVTPRQLGEELGYSESTVRHWVQEGKIQALRGGPGPSQYRIRREVPLPEDKKIRL